MNAIQEIQDENIRKIAQTLKTSGLASSETEAVRMAMMMSKTSQKVTQSFDEKRTINHANPFVASSVHTQSTQHTDITYSVRASSSAQEKPRKTEEKEEFIFGDVQEKEPVQKKDVYKVENEFEEIVVQEVIDTKEASKEVPRAQPIQEVKPVSNSRPSMFGTGSVSFSKPASIQQQEQQPMQRPVQHIAEPVHVSQQMPMQKPALNPSSTPATAASSAQMAFASLLGNAQKTQIQHQEQKPTVQSSPAQASYSKPAEAAPVAQQPAYQPAAMAQPVRVVIHAPDPRANMMKEANVDLSAMFNVNK